MLLGMKKDSITSMSPTPPPANKLYVRWCSNQRPSGSITESTSRSINNRRHTSSLSSHADVFASSFRRRTHFMDSCLQNYHLMLKAADVEMEKAIEELPITKWQ